jgi:GNAT superfamily N-acetyltransferase
MLYLADKLSRLTFSQLMAVYAESNRENAEEFWPELSENERLLRAEEAFYQYLKESFFKTSGAVYAMWMQGGKYAAALRLEPYEDGLLLEALETHPEYRNRGFASDLLTAVLEKFPEKIYSHVGKRNTPSLRVHEKCGFRTIKDYAVYIDGSVNTKAWTLCRDE